jgi:transcriptional regulator with XRE-family HTH domain
VNNNFEEELKQLGQRIKEIRLEKNLTQSGDIRTIQRIEKGTLNMSLKILYLIADVLEIHPAELIVKKEIE